MTRVIRWIISAILIALGGTTPASAYSKMQQVSGRVTYVFDGDTFAIGRLRIRIANIDAPELGHRGGAASKRALYQMIHGRHVTCVMHGRRSYNREIANCYINGQDIGDLMIAKGHARRWY